GDLRIHQWFLQSASTALSTGLEKPGRFRTEGGLKEHLGRHKNVTGPIDLTQQEDMDEMVQLTFSYAEKAGLDFGPLATTDFIERLAFTCCDRWGLVIEMLIEAFTLAVVKGDAVCSDDHFMGAYATLYGGTAGYSPLTAPNYRDNFDQQVLFDMFEKTNEKKGTSFR
ncbi:MAG: hypothetical protein IKE14_13150, partial [Loktanella sp.]|nr:hypothetical protein [Loktanella sp.]